MIHREETLSSEVIYDGKLIRVRKETVTVKGGRTATRELVDHPDGAAIAAITEDHEIVMVKQFRKPIETTIWEVPAGKTDPGEDPMVTAKRELEEETGYRAEHMELLTAMYPSVGFMDEKLYIYLATGLTRGENHPDEDEDLIIETMDLGLMHEKVMAGEIEDAKTIIAILMAWERVRNQ